MSGRNMHCCMFLHERSESGNHESIFPKGSVLSGAKYNGGLDEWFKSAVY